MQFTAVMFANDDGSLLSIHELNTTTVETQKLNN